MKQKDKFNKIIKFLDENNIEYWISHDGTGIYAFEHPKDLRVFYTDAEIYHSGNDMKVRHTGKFRYDVCYTIWNRYKQKKCSFKTQKEVISCIKRVNKLFNINYDQLKLFWTGDD